MVTHALDPRQLFRRIDATNIDEETYEFSVDDEPLGSEERSIRSIEVEFEDLSDSQEDLLAALKEIRNASREVDSVEDVPDYVDTQFEDTEDGNLVTYYCDTTRMGYEIVRQEEPKLAAYSAIFPELIVKVTQ